MKRINLKTNQPFKRGDIREDGKCFLGYHKKVSKKTGCFYESWGNKKYISGYMKTYNPAKKLFLAAKARALKNNAECTITEEWIQDKLNSGYCELTGIPFNLAYSSNTKNNPYAPSIDRIDAKNKNYTPSNVRVVLSFVNIAINDLGLKKALPIFKALVEKNQWKD